MAGVVKADKQQEVVSVELPAPPGWKKIQTKGRSPSKFQCKTMKWLKLNTVFKADVFDKYMLSNPMAYVTLGILKFQALSISDPFG
ncbi:hypothetical protein IEQ34_015752 [Dendrobium chrysotoxum]|uniref:Uncharacterized protein n=1 Tax=Dendrobium chrysotoxum TaxID=161865 RepID=A0AAV7GIU0_DENCH|nr:hypothetical protein IEQ34_015752 [Dendrobium chrysotoxum]